MEVGVGGVSVLLSQILQKKNMKLRTVLVRGGRSKNKVEVTLLFNYTSNYNF